LKSELNRVQDLRSINPYVGLMHHDYAEWAYDADEAPAIKGKWRELAFKISKSSPLDLEIGCGNGLFFAHRAISRPERLLVGIELKYKPLVQAIRRARVEGALNARIVRYEAGRISDLFGEQEINDVFIFFPDPWPRQRSHKHRLIQRDFLDELFDIVKPGSSVEFKTDNLDYFDWTKIRFEQSKFEVVDLTYDLHSSIYNQNNFETHFEKLWTSKGLKTNYLKAKK